MVNFAFILEEKNQKQNQRYPYTIVLLFIYPCFRHLKYGKVKHTSFLTSYLKLCITHSNHQREFQTRGTLKTTIFIPSKTLKMNSSTLEIKGQPEAELTWSFVIPIKYSSGLRKHFFSPERAQFHRIRLYLPAEPFYLDRNRVFWRRVLYRRRCSKFTPF